MDFGRNDYNDYIKNLQVSEEVDTDVLTSDEPVFLIRGSDPLGPKIMLEYAGQLMTDSIDNLEVVRSVIEHAQKMIGWQKLHGTKVADLKSMNKSKIAEVGRIEEILSSLELEEKISESDFDELQKLMDSVYGPRSMKVLYPNEYNIDESGIRLIFNGDDHIKVNLVLGITEDKRWIILKKNI